MHLGRFRLDKRKDFLLVRIIIQWKRFLRVGMKSQLLEVLGKIRQISASNGLGVVDST